MSTSKPAKRGYHHGDLPAALLQAAGKILEKEGYVFRTQSDTEVILAAFDLWNSECIEHFDGMFAFAIWDEREKSLFLARDRVGRCLLTVDGRLEVGREEKRGADAENGDRDSWQGHGRLLRWRDR